MPNVLTQLEQIELDIVAGEEQIARQQEVIDELTFRGEPTEFPSAILKDLEDIQARQIALRDKLRAEVARRAGVHAQPLRAADSWPSSERM